MRRSIFYKYEKYWRKRKNDKIGSSGLELFDIRCLAQSLLTDEERQVMDEYLFHEQFLQILVDAMNRNDTEQLHETLHESKLNLNFFDLEGLSPLHIVCKHGHNEILQLLLQRGAQCNVIDRRHGHSPLQIAAMHGHHACVATLLQNNADICYFNAETTGKTALHFACENGNLMCIKELLVSRELNIIKKNELAKVIQTTLNMLDNNGLTPLHLSVIDGNLACAKLLLEAGANANVTNAEGKTALSLARQMGNDLMVSLLQPYTSESLPSSPVGQSPNGHSVHPYAAFQSPSSSSSSSSSSVIVANGSSFSEAVEAESSLFDGCSVVYDGDSSSRSSTTVVRYVVVVDMHLVEEEGSPGRIVTCSTRELAETVAEKFTKQLNEVHLRHNQTSVLKSDMMGNTMNNNSNIFSKANSNNGLGDWGRRRSLDTRSNSSEDIGKNYKRWAVSGLHQSIVGIADSNSTGAVSSNERNGSGKDKKCVIVEVSSDQLRSLSDCVLYDSEATLLLVESPKNGTSSVAGAVFISQQLEAEDPLWEQYKQQHTKSVVVVTSVPISPQSSKKKL